MYNARCGVINIAQPEWEEIRQTIKGWLASRNRSIRSMAEEAGIQPSVVSRFLNQQSNALKTDSIIRLYAVLRKDMKPLERRDFLRAAALLPLAFLLGHDSVLASELEDIRASEVSRGEAGTRLMLIGNEVAQSSWKEAIPWFHRAEKVLGVGTSQAARAGLAAAQLFLNLGDHDRAGQEVIRVQHAYQPDMDRETLAEVYRIKGWLDYYHGRFPDSERWLRKCIGVSEETGVEALAESAQHFLGRVYSDWAQTQREKSQADLLYHNAQVQFDIAYQIHLRWGTESQRAFDLLRKAQSYQVQGDWREAFPLRNRAREMFRHELAILHIDLEEARWALLDGELRKPTVQAEGALRGWAEINYAKGMADALRILGTAECIQGSPERALEHYIAALCIFPFENHLANRQLWAEIADLRGDLLWREDRKAYSRLLQRIRESVEARAGRFSYLGSVTADRNTDVAQIFERLWSGG
jgi:tetratricopeptide (TPR) repeat protein